MHMYKWQSYNLRMSSRLPNLEVLELLAGVDDHGSLSAAGRMAQMSQPNASRAIKALERRLAGCRSCQVIGSRVRHRRQWGSDVWC